MVMEFPDYTDETALTDIFRHNKVDTIISAILGTAPNLKHVGGHLIDAAVKSGTVERFCPNSFGIHIGAIPWGISKMVDAKKEMQEKVRDSGMKWTNILVGGLFSYFLPSLRNGHGSVGSFDHIDTVFHSNSVEDAGLMIALAATDDRTVNKYVQFQYNPSTQSKNLALVKRLWPNHEFPEKHLDEFELIRLMHEDSDNDIWGVLYAVFCMGRTNCADFRGTILGNTIMPSDFKCTTIEECLSDPSFVFLDHP
ncbi:Leucoanthocyanidin reductase [Perkinsus chesapeaki]|uniref:Leucoanthocyanidin reductase n=1 Tax=Perkinsus chesapeaki TaxID=330153 RepID=A0A7J6KP43_PERCH|nr:Leucoanthocyanidin reductase [Perkinsus chesapeaki]